MNSDPQAGRGIPPIEFPGLGGDWELNPASLDTLLDWLERSNAHSGFDSENTRRLYLILDHCQHPDRARQALRTLAMLVHLHYCENDEFELRERSREGAQLARQLGDSRALRRFLTYASVAEKMHLDFQRSWAGVLIILLLGTLGAASLAFRGLITRRAQ